MFTQALFFPPLSPFYTKTGELLFWNYINAGICPYGVSYLVLLMAGAWRLGGGREQKQQRLPCHPDVLGKQCKNHTERQKGSKWEREEERESEIKCTKDEGETQKKDTEWAMPMGKTGSASAWALLLVPETRMTLPLCISLM